MIRVKYLYIYIYIESSTEHLNAYNMLHFIIFCNFYKIQTIFWYFISPQVCDLKLAIELLSLPLCILVILLIMANQPISVATGSKT